MKLVKELKICVCCGDNYSKTALIQDWLQCNICHLWVHQNWSEFDMCSECRQIEEKLKLEDCRVKREKQNIYELAYSLAVLMASCDIEILLFLKLILLEELKFLLFNL